MEQTNNNNKTYLWVAVGCLVIFICVIAVFIFGFGGLVWLGLQTPDNVTTSINTPINANAGDDFEFTITVTNTGTDAFVLTSIDISLDYLEGFVISETSPPHKGKSQYDALGGGETFQSYTFQRTIAAGETVTISFFGKAILAGDFSGTIFMCVDNEFNCATNVARTIIN